MSALAVLLLLAAGDVLEKHECFRCHAYEPANFDHDPRLMCSGCHKRLSSGLIEDTERRYDPEVWQRFVRRTSEHFVDVPPLIGLSRLRTSWLKSFLRAPYDLRPQLSESMIRNKLTDADVKALARKWGTKADEKPPARPSDDRLAEGERKFDALGCPGCHMSPPTTARAQKLAPDLIHTRARMNYSDVVAYIDDPKAVSSATDMPYGLHDQEASKLLADYVYFGKLPALSKPALQPPPYDAGTPVTYDEVEARVFKRVCWHCHANPDFANGNGGPGVSGGFGYAPRGLSFASFAEVMNGSKDDQGRAQSIFRPGKSGEPVLLEVLRARYAEEAGQNGAAVGMPLGLPALSRDDFALVERWVKGGRRPPKRSSPDTMRSPNLSERSMFDIAETNAP